MQWALLLARHKCVAFMKLQVFCQMFDTCRLQLLISDCSKAKIKESSSGQAITKITIHLHLTVLHRYKLVQIH